MVSTEQVAEFERHRQGQAMMTTYISSAIREKKQVYCHITPFLVVLFFSFAYTHRLFFSPCPLATSFSFGLLFFHATLVIINMVESTYVILPES